MLISRLSSNYEKQLVPLKSLTMGALPMESRGVELSFGTSFDSGDEVLAKI